MFHKQIITLASVFILFIFNCESKDWYFSDANHLKTAREDLKTYLNVIENLVDNCQIHYFPHRIGIFMTKVNLKRALLDGKRLDRKLVAELQRLIRKIESHDAESGVERLSDGGKKAAALFTDDTYWVPGLKKFKPLNFSDNEYVRDGPPEWQTYKTVADDVFHAKPSPHKSDHCLSSLYTEETFAAGGKCPQVDECQDMVLLGSNFAYAYTHRLLYLELAHFGANCSVFSLEEDFAIMDSLCKGILKEAEYISTHPKESLDIFVEQIALCSLIGAKDFLRRDWIRQILPVLDPYQCMINLEIKSNNANHHLSAVTVAALGGAVRYLLETYENAFVHVNGLFD